MGMYQMMAWMMKMYKRKMTFWHFLVKDQVVKVHQTFQQQLERCESCEYSLVQWQASEASISHGLQVLGSTPFAKKRWQPSLGNMDSPPVPSCSKRSYLSNPTRESRFDNKGHFPMLVEKQNRCKLCKTGFANVTCMQCKVHLCFTQKKNWYLT